MEINQNWWERTGGGGKRVFVQVLVPVLGANNRGKGKIHVTTRRGGGERVLNRYRYRYREPRKKKKKNYKI